MGCGFVDFNDTIIRLYTLQGELKRFVKTKSQKGPEDIKVTRSGVRRLQGRRYNPSDSYKGKEIDHTTGLETSTYV